MDLKDHEPLYPKDGTRYYAAMASAIEEFEAWETSRQKLGGGIQIFTTKDAAEEFDGDLTDE